VVCPRILLVDDETAVATVLATLLRRVGYDVVTAGSGRDAERFLDERFDALILDLRLPGMRGDAFYYLATARQPWLNSRALFLTGDGSEQAEDLIGATGCRMMQKPFPIPELLAAVERLAPRTTHSLPRVG
jgi:DNA-binding response OmpR family regulator